jgi:ribonuclease R
MFMRERLGEEYGGTVSAATSFGLFVQLDGLYVEGLIHITELGGEYFRFDEARQELRGERSGVRYGVGTRVRVQVSRVDLDSRKIDFRMVRDGAEAQQRGSSGGRRRGGKGDDRASARPVAVDWEGDASAQDELAVVRERDRDARRATRSAAKGGGKGAGRGAADAPVAAAPSKARGRSSSGAGAPTAGRGKAVGKKAARAKGGKR